MSVAIGMDEAGYGPNLGPLVIGLSKWEFKADTDAVRHPDFWTLLEPIVSQKPDRTGARLHIADSKEVYSPSRGLHSLERSVVALLKLAGIPVTTFHDLVKHLTNGQTDLTAEPWFEQDLVLPTSVDLDYVQSVVDRWSQLCDEIGLQVKELRADIVLTERFNQQTEQNGSKGVVLSRSTIALLSRYWDADDEIPTIVTADKHGGRNRYDGLLAEVLEDRMILTREEGRQRSQYRVGNTEIVFRTKAEAEFPVAVASLIAKYVREVAMLCFNRFWQERLSDLKPTKGYPVDAARFREAVNTERKELGISLSTFWRNK